MSPVNSMFVCIKKKKLSANLFLKWPISIIGKMLNIGADNRSTPTAVSDLITKKTAAQASLRPIQHHNILQESILTVVLI